VGYFFALLSSVLFALYAVPKKFAKLRPVYYVLFMGICCLFVSTISYILFGGEENLFDKYLILSFVGGVSWFIASALFFYCVDKMGLAKSTQFKSLQGPFGSIMILLILSEYDNLNIYYLICASALILISSFMLTVKDEENKKIRIGYILLLILSALLYGFSGFLRKVATMQNLVHSQQIYSALGIVFGCLVHILIKDKKIELKKENRKNYSLSFLSGLFYYFASFFMLLSYKYIEGSVAFSIIQLNGLWAVFIGVFIFKEIDYKKYSKNLLLGLLFALSGIGLLFIC